MEQSGETKLTQEQVDFLIKELHEKFGTELEALHQRLLKDVTLFGKPSNHTIRAKNELMERILKEKNKNHGIKPTIEDDGTDH